MSPARSPGPVPETRVRAALFDLDGVIRRFDVESLAQIERACGLAPKAILRALLEPTRHLAAVTGRISDEAWREGAAGELGERAGQAFLRWGGITGFVDPEVLDLVRRVRRRVPVGLLTNATSRLATDLRLLDLHEAFDAVVNTSEIGVAKPEAEAFRHAAERLGFPASQTLFVDDTPKNVEAASELGFLSHRFTSAEALRRVLETQGLLEGTRIAPPRP